MKCTLLILLALVAFAAADRSGDLRQMITNLARLFSISQTEVEKCIHKVSATYEDIDQLDEVLFDKTDISPDSLRRGTCALTCCAQAQGTMIGAKLQVSVIQKLIQNADMPPRVKSKFYTSVKECSDLVKNVTDECDVGFEFVRCLANKNWEEVAV